MYYKTYAEAKIANPDCEIVTTGEKWNGEESLVGSFAAAIGHGIKPETQSPKQIVGELFDSGKFKYIDNTQHFGENI